MASASGAPQGDRSIEICPESVAVNRVADPASGRFAPAPRLKFGLVKIQASKYPDPTLESVTAAANASLQTIPADFRFTLTDAPGEDSYPIAGTTWAVLYANQTGPKGKELVKFLRWATGEGQVHLKQLRYAPLSSRLASRCEVKLAAIQTRD